MRYGVSTGDIGDSWSHWLVGGQAGREEGSPMIGAELELQFECSFGGVYSAGWKVGILERYSAIFDE